MTGGCCVCGQPITGGVSYTQHCHDECYVRSMAHPCHKISRDFNRYIFNPAHRDLFEAEVRKWEEAYASSEKDETWRDRPPLL